MDVEDSGPEAVLMTRPLPAAPSVPDLVAQTVQVGFGVSALVVEILLRSLGWAAAPATTSGQRVSPATPGQATDVAFGIAWTAVGWAGQAAGAVISVARPVAGALADPPLVPQGLRPASFANGLARTWQRERPQAGVALDNAMAAGVPLSTSAILDRVDIDRLVRTVLDRLDLQALVTAALADLDLDAVVSEAMAQIDVAAVVDSAVQRIDLTQLVIDHVDLGPVVTSALDQIDLDEIVMQRVDVLGLADYVVQGIDLPEIIRMSTGSVASEAVRSVRMQGVDADRMVAGIVDRIILRRRGRVTDAPGDPQSLSQPGDDDRDGQGT
jgi:hypothetical protein